jgi:predicted O-methyltransferase YrrM
MVNAVPPLVAAARASAAQSGFTLSCDDGVGRVLAVLAASVPRGGRVLELGTGVGVGTAWMVHGIGGRGDAEVLTVDRDADVSRVAQRLSWPPFVTFVIGDAIEQLPALGTFDLIFADAQGGKWERLDLTIAALRVGGFLVVDDMTPLASWSEEQIQKKSEVSKALLGHPDLVACEIGWATGIVLSTRART